jgi:hypothetical protein
MGVSENAVPFGANGPTPFVSAVINRRTPMEGFEVVPECTAAGTTNWTPAGTPATFTISLVPESAKPARDKSPWPTRNGNAEL